MIDRYDTMPYDDLRLTPWEHLVHAMLHIESINTEHITDEQDIDLMDVYATLVRLTDEMSPGDASTSTKKASR